MNDISFMLKIHLILISIYSSCICRSNPDRMYKFISDDGKIILKNFNTLSDEIPHIKDYLYDKLNDIHFLSFELYENFIFNPEYYNDILNRNDLIIISIYFDDDLKKLVSRKKVKSSEYVDKFLSNFLHTQSSVVLEFSSLGLTEIPKTIYQFNDLRVLVFSNINLKIFKLDFNYLQKLLSLKIYESKKIIKLDESILNLSSLKTLVIRGCSIKEIPEAINKLENLSSLEISECPIKSFPKNLSNLKELNSLTVSNCALKEFDINIIEHSELENVYLTYNYSLKCLKLLILEVHKEFSHFEITGCPLNQVEILLNLNSPKFCTLNHKKQQLLNFDYVIKFDPKELFRLSKNKRISNLKVYEFDISTGSSSNKTILIREFSFKKSKLVDRNELITKWLKIFKKINLESKIKLRNEFYHSLEFLKNLYVIDVNDYSDWFNYFPPECKEKLIRILFDLFDRLEENNLESQVRSILIMFKRPHSEQLIYFNYLLKYYKFRSRGKDCFISFMKESIEMLKDYAFTVFLNFEKNYECGESLRSYKGDHIHFEMGFDEDLKNRAFKEIVNALISAKKNFDSKFTVDYFSEIFTNAFSRIDDSEFFNYSEITEFISENCDIEPEFFEYERRGNVDIVKRLSSHGMKVLISLIVSGEILIPGSN